MPLDLVTAPSEEPVTVAEAREYLRIDDDDGEAPLLSRMIVSARQMAEQYTNRALVTQTWDWTLRCWWRGRSILVPKPPLRSVTSISYVDSAGDTQTWASNNYEVETLAGDAAVKGSIAVADGVTLPVLGDVLTPVTVRFEAGYGAPSAVPEGIKFGLLMYVADLYENRQSFVVGAVATPLPQTAALLLAPYRVTEIA